MNDSYGIINDITTDANLTYLLRDSVTNYLPVAYGGTANVILTTLYAPVFLFSLFGNSLSLFILARESAKKTRIKAAYIVNLIIADLSGKCDPF